MYDRVDDWDLTSWYFLGILAKIWFCFLWIFSTCVLVCLMNIVMY